MPPRLPACAIASALAFTIVSAALPPGVLPGFLAPQEARATHFSWDQDHDFFEPFKNKDDCPTWLDDFLASLLSPSSGNARVPVSDVGPGWSRDYRSKIPLGGAGRGPTDRTYNSQDTGSGIFGNGWSSPLEDVIVETTDGEDWYVDTDVPGVPSSWHIDPDEPEDRGYQPPTDDEKTTYYFVRRNPDGRLQIDQPDHGSYETDTLGHVDTFRDPFDNETVIARDDTGFPTEVRGPDGYTVAVTKDSAGRVKTLSVPGGGIASYGYDDRNNLTSVRYGDGQAAQYEYDAKNRLTRIASGGGDDLLRLSYDRRNRLATFRYGAGPEWRVAYEPYQGRTTVTSDTGLEWVYLYDDEGRTTSMRGPDHYQRDVVYDGDRMAKLTGRLLGGANFETQLSYAGPSTSRVRRVTQKIGDHTAFADISEDGRTIRIESDSGRYAQVVRGTRGEITRMESSGFAPMELAYDERGRLTTATRGDRTIRLTYDGRGNVASVTDAAGQTVRYAYDAAGRRIRQTQGDGREISFGYDVWGNITALTPAKGAAEHRFGLNELGLETVHRLPEVGRKVARIEREYDTLGRLTKRAMPDGRVLRMEYDTRGATSAIHTPRGRYDLTYTDKRGFPASIQSPEGHRVEYEYDTYGRLAKATTTGPVSGTVRQSYDNLSRVSYTTIAGSGSLNYGYDVDGLLTRAGALELVRDPGGLVSSTKLGRVATSLQRNDHGEVTQETVTFGERTLRAMRYDRDSGGRVVKATESKGGTAHTWEYGYDAAGRLTTAKRDGKLWEQYGYDANGNRSEIVHGKQKRIGEVDARDRLTRVGDVRYEYDESGTRIARVVKGRRTTYTTDILGQLREVRLATGKKITYEIDAEGRRVGKRMGGKRVQSFLYWDLLHPLAELDGNGKVTSRFVYASRSHVPDYLIKNGNTFRILSDRRGSPRLVVNASNGKIVQELDYDPWGKVLRDTNPGFQPFGFAGGLYDPDTGLVRFGARDYDPDTGHWTAPDPISFGGGTTNLYEYAGSDPINSIDPTGLYFTPDTIIDLLSVGWSLYDFWRCRNLTTLLLLGLDLLALALPLVPAGLGHAGKIDDVWDVGRGLNGAGAIHPWCFPAGTIVHTPDGPKPIERLQPGDEVLTRNPVDGEDEVSQVANSFTSTVSSLSSIQAGDEVLLATDNHLFFVVEKGWTRAAEIKRGDGLVTLDGQLIVTAIDHVEGEDVFNVDVTGAHTYFVTDSGILAHNSCAAANIPPPSIRSRLRNAGLHGLPGGGSGPTGPFRYIPPKGYRAGNPLPRNGNGYVDRFGNVWVEGPYHGNPDFDFHREWDVQLSPSGKDWWHRYHGTRPDYINVRPDGHLSH